jgi:hypothetical protein
MTEPTPDAADLIEQAKEIMASFRELERVLLEANRAVTKFSAALYYAQQSLEQPPDEQPGQHPVSDEIDFQEKMSK